MAPATSHELDATDTTFPTDTSGLPACEPSTIVDLADGDTYELHIAPVTKVLGEDIVRMLAYNGSIPGPTLRVPQGAGLTIRVVNDGDHETTVHWHGLRLDNEFDGVPHETQAPIPVGGSFTYRLRVPDDGLYWYHPHVREDHGIEMGLYGNILVDRVDRDPIDRELLVTLDDVLVEDGRIRPFLTDGPTHTAMGRFGNVMLTGGATHWEASATTGEVLRFLFTNTANTRTFNVAIPGARMKLVGGDSGRYERDEWVDAVMLGPSERAVVDVCFDEPGTFELEHRIPGGRYVLGAVDVVDGEPTDARDRYDALEANDQLAAERAALEAVMQADPDKTLVLDALMPILYGDTAAPPTGTYVCPMHPEVTDSEASACPKCGMKLVASSDRSPEAPHEGAAAHGHGHDSDDGIEWEDLMPEINARTDAHNMVWKLVDAATGKANKDIDWRFAVGDRVKIRIVNTMDSEHPMHHPFHIHGAGRFLVVARDGQLNPNLVWKDTVLIPAGETTDILFEVTEPGRWMAHCHIAEHHQNGMMFTFTVDP